MNSGPLVFVLILLVLILTGTLGIALGIIGWIIAGIIILALIYAWWQGLMLPFRIRAEIRTLRRQIKRKQSLGYETEEMEQALAEFIKLQDPAYRESLKRRRELGYDD